MPPSSLLLHAASGRGRAGRARINYPREWSRRSDFSTSTSAVLPAPPCAWSLVTSSLRPSRYSCAPLRIEIRSAPRCRSLMSCAGMLSRPPHVTFASSPLPPSPNSVTRNPTAIAASSRCCSVLLSAIQLIKRSTEFFSSDRDDRRWERKKGGEKEQRNERTDEPRYRFGSHSRCAGGNSRRH